MPDLGNLLNSSSLSVSLCPNLKPSPLDPCDSNPSLYANSVKALCRDDLWCHSWDQGMRFPDVLKGDVCTDNGLRVLRRNPGAVDRSKKALATKSLEDHVTAWAEKKIESGIPELRCFLPFLAGAPRLVECLVCHNFIYPGEEVLCSVRGCQGVYHLMCAKRRLAFSISRKFKCPQHRLHWRCVRCTKASHDKCAPWPDKVIHLRNQPGRAVCWRHPGDWRLDNKHAVPANNIEKVFCRLPLPYVEEEFRIDVTWKDVMENKMEPPPFVHIRRNVYLVKKKRDDADDGIGCTNCTSICSEDCVCRVQSISCSKACHCSEMCTNRPFRKEKKIKIVKTELCGWGVEAAEFINKGDFIIEYIGEVIDDALCERRLWDMKDKGVQNFYMCEIRKNFTIDATFKGNSSRFLNHSCDPNCKLEKWQVDGETRVGVFAARSIEVGEPLTYDYRFVQFGPEVKCHCGATNCQGYLGTKRKIGKVILSWGLKRKRTSTDCLALITV
ncbi:histone-lysine N-methyltransferase ASHR3 isoform X2 [Malania oleifera]|uniref:histone-lysine N-methyltransferase ASHR3 isoform X2 n=1 Tax=Malania oleifera TaxID=397392 RepID=UPI0025AEA443|nr:histone-lysine N-methyltransferase ASHR3 isoform X2 [Malania oleifera]